MGKGGDTGEGPLASDPMFAPFLAEHFDAMEYASTSLSSSSATAQVYCAVIDVTTMCRASNCHHL